MSVQTRPAVTVISNKAPCFQRCFTARTQRDAGCEPTGDAIIRRSGALPAVSLHNVYHLQNTRRWWTRIFFKKPRCHLSCPLHQLTLGMCLITFFEDAVFVIPLLQPALLRRHLSWPADSSRVLWRHTTQCRGGFRGVLKYGAEDPPPV